MARSLSHAAPALPVLALMAHMMLAPSAQAARESMKPDGSSVPVTAVKTGPVTKTTEEKAGETGNSKIPEVLHDLSLLPKPVKRLREQLMEAAHTGDIEKLRPILEGNGAPPVVSFGDGGIDPISFWKAASGDGEGREILAILIEVLEAGFVRIEQGTPEELYVWPYFAQYPLGQLTPVQEVELYKLVTAQDKQDMDQFGAYNFYRAGISPDGRWRYFVAGD